MDLKYVVLTILKILISTPTILLSNAHGAALMGGHLDNRQNNSRTNLTDVLYNEYDFSDSQEMSLEEKDKTKNASKPAPDSEEIPDPSPLVVPGYNLPENIFNQGKPFYVEKDPLTGKIDFTNKSPNAKLTDDLYDYIDEEPKGGIYDKSNIDRKDGGISHASHRPSDVNQLTPNFHDFLNLPVKYNPEKYVYPLISSSYASTKIQGSVNKFHNHKDNFNVKITTTKKPNVNPTYYSTQTFFNTKGTPKTTTTSSTTTTTTAKPTTIKRYPEIYLTTKTPIGHPNFNVEYEYYDVPTSKKEIYLTTQNPNSIYLTTKSPTTTTTAKRVMSIFEQLFGDYDETVTTTEKTKPPNLPTKKETKTEKYITSTTKPTSTSTISNINVLTGSSMGLDENYEYEDDYNNDKIQDNIAVESKPVKKFDDSLTVEPLNPEKDEYKNIISSTTQKITTTTTTTKKPTTTTQKTTIVSFTEDYEYEYDDRKITTKSTTTTHKPTTTTTTAAPTSKVTSLPLGENHINTPIINKDPIIVATQNLREKLNGEKVQPAPFEKPIVQHAPSTSSIHIAPDQDTVSFVMGNHQSVESQYVGTSIKESPYDSNPFRPLYGQQASYSNEGSDSYRPVKNEKVAEVKPQSAVTIHPLEKAEASLSIGVPVNSVTEKKPGQVVDEKLENTIQFPKSNGSKIVFPNEKQETRVPVKPVPTVSIPIQPPHPPLLPHQPHRDVLQFNAKPTYHQLPSDLTPPREKDVLIPSRIRPPWDPRPGHFFSGKPEYVRPPRPPPDMAYKRIDNLPNILPQFRPNVKPHVHHHHHVPPPYLENRYNRQPLLDRPSNKPVGFLEKLQPPPPPFPNHKKLQNLRKVPPQSLDETPIAEDRIMNEVPTRQPTQEFGFYQTPPQIKIANRRHSDDDEVETLQMIQAKQAEEKKEVTPQKTVSVSSDTMIVPAQDPSEKTEDKTIYKVYPVNSAPIKMDAIENKKEAVVIGTRAELPLPPSKINQDFVYDQNPIFDLKDRKDAPILKPHVRPSSFPIKSDFPYPLERPDPSAIHPVGPDIPSSNNLDEKNTDIIISNNQWNTIGENLESRIVNAGKINSNQLISATLKTYTEKPIAVAYTPTEPNLNADKYSMPNYGGSVIPEIRPGMVENAETGYGDALLYTQPNLVKVKPENIPNHRIDAEIPTAHDQLDFQAPFQASMNIDSSLSQGWSVVRDKNKTTTETAEVTTLPLATTSEFDIENFKPQLEGGFKPIYTLPDEDLKVVGERQE